MIVTERMRIDPAYRERLRALDLDEVGKVLSRVQGRVAAWSRTTDTLHVPGTDGLPGFYVKRHYFPSWPKRLRGAFRGTFFGSPRSGAEYRALNTMRHAGVPAVRAVAWGTRRVVHFISACYLVTEEVPGARNLTTFASEVADGRRQLSRRQRLELIETLAEQTASLHASGCSHGNLFWRNLLVRFGPDGRPEFFYLDAQPLRWWERWRAGGRWWLRELAQLAVSARPFTTRTERLRFFARYAGEAREPGAWRDALREIERLADAWREHEERRIHMNRLFENWNRQMDDEERRGYGDADAMQRSTP